MFSVNSAIGASIDSNNLFIPNVLKDTNPVAKASGTAGAGEAYVRIPKSFKHYQTATLLPQCDAHSANSHWPSAHPWKLQLEPVSSQEVAWRQVFSKECPCFSQLDQQP